MNTKQRALNSQLAEYNQAIDELCDKRRNFILDNLQHFAPFRLGQKVINSNTLRLGIVYEYYQYSNDPWDCFNVHCGIQECDNNWDLLRIIHNTSGYIVNPWVDFKEYQVFEEYQAYLDNASDVEKQERIKFGVIEER